MNNNEIINQFLDQLKFEKRYSEHTIKAYESDLLQFNQYLIDDYDNPVYIDSAEAMHERCRARWYEVLNDWHNQYQELKKVRRVGQLSE